VFISSGLSTRAVVKHSKAQWLIFVSPIGAPKFCTLFVFGFKVQLSQNSNYSHKKLNCFLFLTEEPYDPCEVRDYLYKEHKVDDLYSSEH